MTTDDIRAAFVEAAAPGVTLHDAQIEYAPAGDSRWLLETDGKTQRLKFTGWHADGTPFAFVSAAFAGDPIEQTRNIAHSLSAAHTGTRSIDPMSRPASGLARLLDALKSIDIDANATAAEFEAQSARVHGALAVTKQIVGTVKQAADDLEAVNAQYSNGGPTTGSA